MNTKVQWWALAFAVLLAVIATGATATRVRRRSDGTRLRFADAATGVLAIGAIAGVAGFGAGTAGLVGLFGIASVLWFAAVVGVPLHAATVGATAVVAARRSTGGAPTRAPSGPTRPAMAALALGLVPGALGAWGMWVEPDTLEVEHPPAIALSASRTGQEPIRVGVLTDLQTRNVGEHEQEAVDALMAEQPDLILLPGDVFQGSRADWDAERAALVALLARIRAPGGVFLVPGDADTDWQTDRSDRIEDLARDAGVRFLGNEVVLTHVRDRAVRIGGVRLDYRSTEAEGTVAVLEHLVGDEEIRILLAHRPDVVDSLPPNPRTDLVVAGHTHGGQISVPGYGPLFTMTGVPRSVAAGGLHEMVGGRRIYVGRGVGMERAEAPPVRLGVPPNIGILTLGA